MYQMFIAADWCSPTEFWSLRPGEVFWILRAKTQVRDAADKWADLYSLLKDARDE